MSLLLLKPRLLLPLFRQPYYSCSPVLLENLHKFRVNTNTAKQMISFMAIDLLQELAYKFKDPPKSICFLQEC